MLAGAAGAVAAAAVLARPAAAGTVLRLGHALPASHPVHASMELFAQGVKERTGGEVTVQLYADGMVGQEPSLREQIKAGTLDLTKLSASGLEGLSPRYRVFEVPFLVRHKAHWRAVAREAVGQEILAPIDEAGVVGLTYYDAGARSFYGRTSILHPDDLKGLTIRVQLSPVMIRMMALFGAEARPLPWHTVYSALQLGLVDGAENNLTALTYGRHAEVVRYYAFTEHTFVPDVLLVSARAWAGLAPKHREALRAAAHESALHQVELWAGAEAASKASAEKLGVTFQHPDKTPFMQRVAALRREMADDPLLGRLIAAVEGTA